MSTKKKVINKKWHLSKMKVNTLRWVQKQILEEPRRFDMSILANHWTLEEVKDDDSIPSCGTTACIAGWYAIKRLGKYIEKKEFFEDPKTGKKKKETYWTWKLPQLDEWKYAAKELGIGTKANEYGEAERLFLVEGWPEPFRKRWDDVMDLKTERGIQNRRAKTAVARIEHFIQTGE